MCGIIGAFDLKDSSEKLRPQILEMSKRIRHRGPDWSGIFTSGKAILAHERLAIVDPKSGSQPLYSPDGQIVLAVNGEIYNHKELRATLPDYEFSTNSDSEVVLALYQAKGPSFIEDLNGIFAFALYDASKDIFLVARDHMGIIPLYYGSDDQGQFFVSSELKSLEGFCTQMDQFPPGHYLYSADGLTPQRWYQRDWDAYDTVKDADTDIDKLRTALEDAVHRQLMSDVPYGVLLSGGLDSSVIAAITKKFASKRIESGDQEEAWYPQLHSFAVGLKGAPDLIAAQRAADHIGTIHHEINFTIQEGLDAIRDVIYHLETYDVTTIRASTPMYLLARVIKSMGIKMVLSGEGSDELFGGYLYFHKAPNAQEFHEETVRKLKKLYLYDCLRANKSLAAWGVEGRVPFLDKEFIDVAMTINPKDKMIKDGRMEKWVVRKAFEDYLPESIAWRQKEQFSDGVGYSWIDTLKAQAEEKVSDTEFATAADRFPVNTPKNKEEFLYRTIFESHFPSEAASKTVPSVKSVACSTPEALAWDASFQNLNDPSGRAVAAVHNESYEKAKTEVAL
ncbi:asparagine synthase B [Sphingobacterium spiritivorum]|uniref:asparagine synthase (glutamine-hydrolyzing) n=1 Tax=Sphingobacterium spiritivorum ATCC 33861 TaxID=525373 RepID=D7VPM7_SPHSI|nr:asparagine synthase B [Sphingobacterium spiritivorum]EFK57874.1 asparagine synthase (glutamine-hydrolyzing) [Sphingobacterium spiritivorum ATCC 33861]QQT36103.1 asparagine synthase B [Sphingobacterium spiritivorum]WQD32836.1 asparagine synthase B [Sphingobacterium spiritivorum]SUJ15319.1 Asparagine synthetase B [glutamine-hydrolyzing] [Sphingobacterium spiritivorum]